MYLQLRSVRLVQRQELVADQVVPRRQSRRDRRSPLQRLEDHRVAPAALVDGSRDQSGLVDLSRCQCQLQQS